MDRVGSEAAATERRIVPRERASSSAMERKARKTATSFWGQKLQSDVAASLSTPFKIFSVSVERFSLVARLLCVRRFPFQRWAKGMTAIRLQETTVTAGRFGAVRRTANDNHWAVILAGGDGTRLRSLTRAIAGDDRPKQFCEILG